MEFVATKKEIIDNIIYLEKCLNSSEKKERSYAKDLVRRGKTIIVYKMDGENHFAPSRFVGYSKNTLRKHFEFEEKDGRDTNPVIAGMLGNPFGNQTIDEKFINYCNGLGLDVPNNARRYWRIMDDNKKYLDLERIKG